ncbi:MAG: hypothetical protein Kow00123_12080 [Anaerolineales bacterium]
MDAPTLTPRQARFVGALMTTRTVAEAARVAGVGERTARRWLRLPAVQRALSEAQGEALKQATRRAVAAIGLAVDILQVIMADPGASAGARVSAARCILDAAARLTETAELADRVSRLEQRIGGET